LLAAVPIFAMSTAFGGQYSIQLSYGRRGHSLPDFDLKPHRLFLS
jgi:hypothetical protein